MDLSKIIIVYCTGCLTGLVLVPIFKYLWVRNTKTKAKDTQGGTDSDIYGLEHATLNIEFPPKTMWMNMGYWEKTKSFPEANRALLDETLKLAGLLTSDGKAIIDLKSNHLRLVDVGFGCGDQTIHLTQDGQSCPGIFKRYTGITIDKSQFTFAHSRLSALNILSPSVQIFCADAAKPETWSEALNMAIEVSSLEKQSTNYVLALDTLIHFTPSRKPLFLHAFHSLRANFLAYDLILQSNPSPSMPSLILLFLISFLTSIPFMNFLTEKEYVDQLVDSGYTRERIQIRDVSEHVFAGLADFVGRRDKEIGVGKFRVVGWVFGWWARSGIVRGVIVSAKR